MLDNAGMSHVIDAGEEGAWDPDRREHAARQIPMGSILASTLHCLERLRQPRCSGPRDWALVWPRAESLTSQVMLRECQKLSHLPSLRELGIGDSPQSW